MRLVPYRRMGAPAGFWPETSLLDGLVRDFFTSSFPGEEDAVAPAVDILERDGDLLLRVELPGMEEKDIELKLEGRVLTLRGERRFENEDQRGNYHRIERRYGSFNRSFTLPDTADLDKVKANYKNGVLTVTVPQRPDTKPREIAVSVS